MDCIRESATLGGKEIVIETGRMAKQADGAVLVQQGETVVLVTVVGGPPRDLPFFPLTCDYVEKSYAAGFIPGGYFRREARQAEHEILACRLIDRPLRPLFPKGYRGDTQVIATVLSADRVHPADVLSITGASAALMLSDLPWGGPIAGLRVGRVGDEFIANPTTEEIALSDMNIVMACSREAIVMVEGSALNITEADLMDAFEFGRDAAQRVLDLQVRLQEVAGRDKRAFEPPVADPAIVESVIELATKPMLEALEIPAKIERQNKLAEVKTGVKESLAEKFEEQADAIGDAFEDLKKKTVRKTLAKTGKRIDGRSCTDVRPITTEVSVLPRTHGSALFTRGETQALVTVTLGTARENQRFETLEGDQTRRFLLHYNFPPFSVGESKFLRGPSRRDIGHGTLARRAITSTIPLEENFPYTLRVVSEVLESNGSSSMATVCGGSLALMDAGVPVTELVAGVAMGLINEDDKFIVLTDILGDEDHLGDMDFKVAGTYTGITAIQMDTKIAGVTRKIMEQALDQAKDGRLHILDEMAKSISTPRTDLSRYAPRIITLKVKPDRIRDVIGPGGKNIRGIVEATGVAINVEDDGSVQISSMDDVAAQAAIKMVKGLTAEAEIGAIYHGVVAKVADFGAFVTILPNQDGLCHISELCNERVDKVTDILREGDEVIVKCIGLERGGKIKLSRKEALGQKPTHSMLESISKRR